MSSSRDSSTFFFGFYTYLRTYVGFSPAQDQEPPFWYAAKAIVVHHDVQILPNAAHDLAVLQILLPPNCPLFPDRLVTHLPPDGMSLPDLRSLVTGSNKMILFVWRFVSEDSEHLNETVPPVSITPLVLQSAELCVDYIRKSHSDDTNFTAEEPDIACAIDTSSSWTWAKEFLGAPVLPS